MQISRRQLRFPELCNNDDDVHHLTPRRKNVATNNAVPPSLHSTAANFKLLDVDAPKVTHAGGNQSPPSAAMKTKQHESSSESDDIDIDSDSDSDASSTSSSPPANKIDRTALTTELAPSKIDITNLSDYELLRLRNIQRNEAKLKSLGLFEGITSKLPKSAFKSEQGRKAAETRRRNKMLAREKVERHEREMDERKRESAGRVQPQRMVKGSTTTNYSAKAMAPSKRRIQWEANLSSLRSFHKQFGTFQISATIHGHGREYKSLQQWKCRQRKEYLLFKEGRKSVLDEEQVSLLEGLGADWLVGGMRAVAASGGERSVSMTSRSKRTTRQASNLWADYSDDDDYEEEQKILAEWEGENSDDDDEVAIGSSDSFSIFSEDSEQYQQHAKKNNKSRRAYYSEPYGNEKSFSREHDLDSDNSEYTSEDESLLQHQPQRKQQKRSSISTSRRMSRRVKRSVSKRSRRRDDSPPVRRSKRQLVSSLELVAPVEIERNNDRSSASLKRSRRYEDEDEYRTPSSRRRLSAYSRREEESIFSAEEETSFQAGSSRRRRKCYVHQRSSRRDEGCEKIVEKPMEEIIVRDIDVQAERDQLMAEYGALYGRKCVLDAKRDLLEKELRGMDFPKISFRM